MGLDSLRRLARLADTLADERVGPLERTLGRPLTDDELDDVYQRAKLDVADQEA